MMKKHVAGTKNGVCGGVGGEVVHYATHFTPTISRLWFHELITVLLMTESKKKYR
jgi:hypothetical protein